MVYCSGRGSLEFQVRYSTVEKYTQSSNHTHRLCSTGQKIRIIQYYLWLLLSKVNLDCVVSQRHCC